MDQTPAGVVRDARVSPPRPVERIAGEAPGERNAPAHGLPVEHQFERVSRLTPLERRLELGHIDARRSELLQIEKKLPRPLRLPRGIEQ